MENIKQMIKKLVANSIRPELVDIRESITAVRSELAVQSSLTSSMSRELVDVRESIAAVRESITAVRSSLAMPFQGDFYESGRNKMKMADYWAKHNVTNHQKFTSAAESLKHLRLRNAQYPGYIELLPVSGLDDKVVLDYGCGPGNDLVGFAHYSSPRQLIGIDISPTSLAQAEQRLALHGRQAKLINVPYGIYELPLEDGSVDYVHCSGVLMLIEDPVRLLREFRRVLKPNGELRLMVYNYDSLWLHLYVAYVVRLENGLYSDVSMRDAFSRTTDGEDCPLVHVWRPNEVAEMALSSNFSSTYLGAALSLWELHLFPKRFAAMLDARLPEESREFLLELEVDRKGLPTYRGHYAGIDACYRLKPCPETKSQEAR